MSLSRAWFAIVAVVAAVAVTAALLVPILVQREVDHQVSSRLQAAAVAADAEVQLHARRWLDAAGHAALDVQLSEALDHASTGTANLDLLHRTAQQRLASFQAEWKAYQLIAVDAHGRVVARAGAGADRWKDDLSSAQVVVEALKGFRLDDTWFEDGKLLKVMAAPLVVRDRYAGALLIAVDLPAELAQPLADRLAIDVAFIAGGRVVGRSAAAPGLEGVLPRLAQQARELSAAGSRGEPIPLATGSQGRVVLASGIRGSVPLAQALVVVIGERPLLATVGALQARFLAVLPQLPWVDLLPIGGGLLATVLLGFFLTAREHGVPLERLHRSALALSRGDAQALEEASLRGRYGTIARSINMALERARSGSRGGRVEVGHAIPVSYASPSAPQAPRAIAVEQSVPLVPRDAIAAAPAAPAPLEPPPAAAWLPSQAASPLPVSPPAAIPSSRSWSASAPLAPDPGAPRGPATGSYPQLDGPAEMPQRSGAPLANLDDSDSQLLSLEPRAEFTPMASMGPSVSGREGYRPATMPPVSLAAPGEEGALAAGPDPLDVDYQNVFQDFVDTRQRCGETVDGLTFDRFAAKLRGNREQLVSRYGCKGVKFQVYVKDGKAALKATPV